jgi:superkiller protein 3
MMQLRHQFVFLLITCFLVGCSWFGSGDPNGDVNAQDQVQTELSDPAALLEEGIRLLENGETEKSIEVLNRAIDLDPDLAEAYFQLGIAYSLIEFRDQLAAVDSVEPVTENTDEDRSAKNRKSNSQIAFEKAVEAYKKRTEANKEDHLSFFNLGRSYAKLDQDVSAANALRQAVRIKPEDTDYQTELGSILMRLARYTEAVAALRKALELDPENLLAEDLLEKAEAGQKRVSFTVIPKDPSKPEQADSNTNSATKPDPANKPEIQPTPPQPLKPKPSPANVKGNMPKP